MFVEWQWYYLSKNMHTHVVLLFISFDDCPVFSCCRRHCHRHRGPLSVSAIPILECCCYCHCFLVMMFVGLVWFGSSSFLEGTKEDRFKIGLGQVTRLIVVVCIHTTATGLIGLVSEVVWVNDGTMFRYSLRSAFAEYRTIHTHHDGVFPEL